ncbi:hypothetical protein SEA_BEARBQ_55 [Gordonia phage BearBQ]|nr:hypothetical protein SEA_BEARBQ_55 [Gordonia phage BearBQ]
MSMNWRITVEHNGSTYYGEVYKIGRTAFGYEDHGILTAYLHCSGGGGRRIGVGGYSLDGQPETSGGDRTPSAYGMDWIVQVMKTVGVESWEELPGQRVLVLFDQPIGLGQVARGIANIDSGEALIFTEHARKWFPVKAIDS